MKVVASTDAYTIYLRRDGRHAVKGADKQPINGDDKVKITFTPQADGAADEDETEPEADTDESGSEDEDS